MKEDKRITNYNLKTKRWILIGNTHHPIEWSVTGIICRTQWNSERIGRADLDTGNFKVDL